MNVILTRAKCLLIVIGDHNTLIKDPNWQELVYYCSEKRAIVRWSWRFYYNLYFYWVSVNNLNKEISFFDNNCVFQTIKTFGDCINQKSQIKWLILFEDMSFVLVHKIWAKFKWANVWQMFGCELNRMRTNVFLDFSSVNYQTNVSVLISIFIFIQL